MESSRIADTIAKTKAFYETAQTGCALIKIKDIAVQPSHALRLTDYCYPADVHRYMDDRVERTIAKYAWRKGLNDDTLPAEGPWYGIAEHSAFLGGSVSFDEETSWHHAMLSSPDELEKLSLSTENTMFSMVMEGISYIREKYAGQLLPMVRGASGALEMANALRGNDFFYDFYEEPEALSALLDRCADALVWYYEKQLDVAGDVYGGVITGFGEWLPGHSLGHVSEDTTTMIRAEHFDTFGKPRTQRVYVQFDNVFLHMHALAEHCLETVTSLPNLTLMELSSDPNTDRAVQVWERNRTRCHGVIPVLRLTREEILGNLELLKTQKTVIWYDAKDLADAKNMCAFVGRELPVR